MPALLDSTPTVTVHSRFHNAFYSVALDGAVGDGSTDDTAAITTAATTAAAAGYALWFEPGKVYKVTSPVTLKGDVWGLGAEIITSYVGVAVELGDGTTEVTRPTMFLPEVRYTGTTWTASTVGIRSRGIVQGDIHIPRVRNFEKGLYCSAGVSTPTAYSQFFIQHLDNNKVNIYIDDGASGSYCNENIYWGGRLSHDSNMGTNNANCHHIKIVKVGANRPDMHKFYGQSVENNAITNYQVVNSDGSYCLFEWLRWENTNPGVIFNSGSEGNAIFGGDVANDLTVTDNGTANELWGGRIGNVHRGVGLTDGIVKYQNSNDSYPSVVIVDAATSPHADVTSSYSAFMGVFAIKGKRTADTQPRAMVDFYNAEVALGSGSAAADVTLSRGATNTGLLTASGGLRMTGPLKVSSITTSGVYAGSGTPEGAVSAASGSVYMRTDGGAGTSFYVKESGSGNTGWIAK